MGFDGYTSLLKFHTQTRGIFVAEAIILKKKIAAEE